MKIVGFVSSPQINGSTYKLVSEALEFAKSKGHDIKLINVNKLNICGCQACNYCKSHNRCKIEDDFQDIYDIFLENDRFIFSSPIYFFDINAQAKLVEDRLYSLIDGSHQTKLKGDKSCVFIYSQGTPDIHAFESNLSKHEMAFGMIGIKPLGKYISIGTITENSKDQEEIKNLVSLLL